MDKLKAPIKGIRPVTQGVKGVLVDAIPVDVVFGSKNRVSPYDSLLEQLKSSAPGNYLRFDGARARPSITARAKKLGMRVLFGEKDDVLYVRLVRDEAPPSSEEVPAEKPRKIHDVVLEAINAGRDTAGKIATFARSNGVPGAVVTQVDFALGDLARASKIKLKKHVPGHEEERWERR